MKQQILNSLAVIIVLMFSLPALAGNCPYPHEIRSNGQSGWAVDALGWRVKSYSAPAYSGDKADWDNHAAAVSINGGYGITCYYSYGPSFDKLTLESTIVMEDPEFSRNWTGGNANKECWKRIEQCTW